MNTENDRKFAEIVVKQTVLYNELKEIIKTEAKVLDGGDLKQLDSLVKNEEKAVSEIKSLEKEKAGVFNKLALAAGFGEGSGVKIMDVIIKLPESQAIAVEKAIAGLIKAVKEVDAVNAANAHLLKNLIEYSGFTKVLTKKTKEPANAVYSPETDEKVKNIQYTGKIDTTI